MQSSEGLLNSIAGWIDEAALAGTYFGAQRAFSARIPMEEHKGPLDPSETEATTRRAAGWAFSYHVQVVENYGKWRVQVIPYLSGPGNSSMPPQIKDVPEIGVSIWESLCGRVSSDFGKARLHHLLFERRVGNVRGHALMAAQSYLKLSQAWDKWLDKEESLNAALRLARAVGAKELASTIIDGVIDAIRRVLSEEHDVPGVILRLSHPLASESHPPKELRDLLYAAIAAHESPFTKDKLYDIVLLLRDGNSTREETHTSRVQVWLDAAEQASGIVKSAHLKQALQRAHASAIPELVDRAAAALQKMRDEDLGLKSFISSATISREQFESLLQPVTACNSWQEALIHFTFAYGPAVGTIENTRKRTDEHSKQFVLADLATTELIGSDGLPRFSPQNDAEALEMRLARQESFNLQQTSRLLAVALHKIAEVHGQPTEEQLTQYFSQSALVTPELAASISRCFTRYWSGDTEAATFTIAPKVETLARNLVVALDVGVYRLQRNEKPGQYPGLGSLLGVLREKGLDESWYRNILTVCGNPAGGWNLRNEIAHGFVDDAGSPAAALLFQCVLYLWTLGPHEQGVDEPQL
ncbi:DUF4209 domain-containing protein [Streptomyces zaomyceticus]|uniref:DUF4209 domain-containing protein n=1 Tax=Streptomyces zaomyceticus TaxID=68286 RepID=UPI00324DF745